MSKAPKVNGDGKHVVTSPGADPVAYETREQAERVAKQVKNAAVVNRDDLSGFNKK